MPMLHELGEDALVRKITSSLTKRDNVLVGPGDDCAVISRDEVYDTLLKTDCIIEGVHYLPDADPYWVGWKAVARVVSDFAAMGGQPEALMVTIALTENTESDYIQSLYTGMQACADKYTFSIVGGETAQLPSMDSSLKSNHLLSISGTGKVAHEKAILRSGAQVNDTIYVTGKLGGSITGHHLTFTPRVHEAAWLSDNISPTAMMDLSDGLAKDLPRLCTASACGFTIIEDKLPVNSGCTTQQAIADGEDYELLFTASEIPSDMLEKWNTAFPETPLTMIGRITDSAEESATLTGGWEHFKTP